nr:telomere length regulator taz1 like [Tanacetum cinerariifolium]
MGVKIASLSCVSTSSLCTSLHSTTTQKVSLPPRLHDCRRLKVGVNTRWSVHGRLNTNQGFSNRQFIFFASVSDVISDNEIESDDNTDQEEDDILIEDDGVSRRSESSGGRPGFISFYNQPYKKEAQVVSTITKTNGINLFWLVGPAVLVASFIFPSLYMRKILSTVFEDSLLTDFLILFFTEALFYCGVAVFLKVVDHLRRPREPISTKNDSIQSPQLVYRITSVAALVLSLVIPMVTMGLVWPWTGPAASATLAPYLVGIVVQFAFEQYARYIKSPSWPLIPVIFQVYRLHQLNRAAQLVTALSFTVRGAESTPHNLAINSSLGTMSRQIVFLMWNAVIYCAGDIEEVAFC